MTDIQIDDKELSNQYLTFFLDDEEYGVEILRVMEIRKWEAPTLIPGASEEILGMINIRGNVVPVIDLRCCFSLDRKEFNQFTVIIIIQIHNGDKEQIVGIVVDRVSDVCNFKHEQLKPVADKIMIDKKFVSGIAVEDKKMIILLSTSNLLSESEIEKIASVSASS